MCNCHLALLFLLLDTFIFVSVRAFEHYYADFHYNYHYYTHSILMFEEMKKAKERPKGLPPKRNLSDLP